MRILYFFIKFLCPILIYKNDVQTNYIFQIYVAILTQINRRKGVISSWLLWIFWIFVVICCVVPLQDNILYQVSYELIVELSASCFATDNYIVMENTIIKD